jgi:hypothetical protein
MVTMEQKSCGNFFNLTKKNTNDAVNCSSPGHTQQTIKLLIKECK